MAVTCHLFDLLILSFLLISPKAFATGIPGMLDKGRNITDGETLLSAGGTFTLGFFSPGVSTKRYLGIWFSVSSDAVCWVANRDRPLIDTSGVLVVSDTGSLYLLDGSGQVAWSSNSSRANSAVAQLLESGNLVLRDRNRSAILWQSFDYPTNSLLPGMKMGKNLWTGAEWYLSSWRSANDPSPGTYRYVTETETIPENVLWDGNVEKYRTGPWNGLLFSGIPEVATYTDMFSFLVTISPGEITFGYTSKPGTPLSRLVVLDTGVVYRLVWDASNRAWQTFFQAPRDVCDAYAKCGPFGLCNANAASTSFCSCLKGFGPASPSAWYMRETSNGCRRNVALDCGNGTTKDGFVLVQGVKLPVTHSASVDMSITVEECRVRCFANCSCMAYAAADIRKGGGGIGCIIWTNNITDVRYVDQGQDLYLRLAESELDEAPHPPFPTALVIGAPIAFLVVVLLVVLLAVIVIRRRRGNGHRAANDSRPNSASTVRSVPAVDLPTVQSATGNFSESNINGRGGFDDVRQGPGIPDNGQIVADDPDSPPNPASTVRSVPMVDLPTIQAATGNFSKSNIIGRGGFGNVYEGQLPDGRKVAVKRLIECRLTNKGEDFTREVQVMSKLMHPTLVELLFYCQEGGEWILVYEYMQKKSLDLYIFGDTRLRSSLNWAQRREIIRGIAVGVAYLHDMQVIHRDLKPSNILLDDTWKPKIADFGTAKLFIDDQTNPTLVLSPGYIAPEYADQCHLTLKCDVYSLGVVLLEIVRGKRRCTVPTFLLDTWELWKQHETEDLLDSEVAQPEPELFIGLDRCIQIGLLCVQLSPEDRPTMSEVVAMLTNSSTQLACPRSPQATVEPDLPSAKSQWMRACSCL